MHTAQANALILCELPPNLKTLVHRDPLVYCEQFSSFCLKAQYAHQISKLCIGQQQKINYSKMSRCSIFHIAQQHESTATLNLSTKKLYFCSPLKYNKMHAVYILNQQGLFIQQFMLLLFILFKLHQRSKAFLSSNMGFQVLLSFVTAVKV